MTDNTAGTDPRVDTGELHDICIQILSEALVNYETADLSDTISALTPLHQTTRTVPRTRRLRGAVALDWMRLHAAVTATMAGAAYDQGRHGDAVSLADRAATVARAAGDGPLAGSALAIRARVVRQHSPAVALQIAGAAGRIAGASPARAMVAGKVSAGSYAAVGDVAGVRQAVVRAWQIMELLAPSAQGRPGFALDTYSPADLALASAEALTTVGVADEAEPYLERAAALIADSGQTGMIIAVHMAQARTALARNRPDPDEAAHHAARAVTLAMHRPAQWVARLVRDVSALAAKRTGHQLDDLIAVTAPWF
ncbi:MULTISPECIES: hypothetical protein [unclassified Frankia]|uniref:hypothetical protein n=1 Tax=unclassified Frankia TaxID=2632575 RepID=UPI002AD2A107|nr:MULTISPECIES: hypothetical protein [unclassified Frankia]